MNLLDILYPRKTPRRERLLGGRHEPNAVAQTIDAARLSEILRSSEAGNMQDFFSLSRDIVTGHGHTLAEFGKRKLAVLAETQTLSALDDEDPVAVAMAEAIGTHFDELPSWFAGMVHLLDSTIYPVSVVEKIYRPSNRPGWRYELEELKPVPYRLLDYSQGELMIRDCGEDGEPLGTLHRPDPLRYIVHRGHLLISHPDTWGGPMRAIIFWWLFAVQDRDWWARFLERFGAPFLEGTFDKNDHQSRYLLERAFSSATRLFGIAVPDDASVQIHQANTQQGGDAFAAFHSTANREISKIVLGQTLSAEGQNLGLGGGQASAQENVRDDIRRYDSLMLAATVRTQIILPLCRLNGWITPAPRIAWGGDDLDTLDVTGDLLSSLKQAGIRVTDEGLDALSKRLALPLERDLSGSPISPLSALAAPTPGRHQAATSRAARQAVDDIAAATAPTLSEAMAEALAPLAAVVDRATSLSELEAGLRATLPGLDHSQAAAIAQAALVSSSVNGAAGFPDA